MAALAALTEIFDGMRGSDRSPGDLGDGFVP